MWSRAFILLVLTSGCVERQNLGRIPPADAAEAVRADGPIDATSLDAGTQDALADAAESDALPTDVAGSEDAAASDAEVEADAGSMNADARVNLGIDARAGVDAATVPNANRLIGYPCVASNQCLNGQGLCLPEEQIFDFLGGYCTAACVNDACPADSLCVQFEDGPDLCFDECGQNSDCRPGYGCVDHQGSGVCFPQNPPLCRFDVDCPSAAAPRCDKPSGQCVRCLSDVDCDVGDVCAGSICTGARPNGAACEDASACLGQSCQPKAYAPGGYCTQNCATDLDCTAGGHCGRFGECLADCVNVGDCRPGYQCLDGDGDFLLECRATGTGTGTVGASCATVTDCQGGLDALCLTGFAIGPVFEDGYCSEFCQPGSCPTGSACVGLGFSTYCLAECTVDADCRQPDYRCLAITGSSVCYPR